MIVRLAARAVSIVEDAPTAIYSSEHQLEVKIAPSGLAPQASRCVVELQRFHGGTAPRVLLGGRYAPGAETLVLAVALQSSPQTRRTCKSALGKRLVPGLPEEFATSVLGGLTRTAELGAGVVTVDRFGVDPVETSPLITELAAEVLGRVLSLGAQPSEEQAALWLQGLP